DDLDRQIRLEFSGSSRLDQATPLTVTTDPAKAQLELGIAKVAEDPNGAKLRITAIDDDGRDVAVPVQLSIGNVQDEDMKALRTVQTGGEIVLSRREAGGPGVHRLRATFAGDDMRAQASATVTLELTSGSTTS